MRTATCTAELVPAAQASRALRMLAALMLSLTLAACAATAPEREAPPVAAESTGTAPAASETGATTGGTSTRSASEVFDPWEPFNRRVHNFNLKVDDYIARPLATAYRAVTPPPVRKGVGNFFANIYQPVTAVHLVLQGRPKQAGSALLRFTVNATLGLAGFFDPATHMGLQQYNEDFGQTLAVWGWNDSRYLVLPLMGSSTLRDGFGRVGDAPLNPLRQVDPERDRFLIQGVGLVDLRATLMDLGELETGTGDSYTLFRDTYLQRRRYQINAEEDQDRLPDYLLEDDLYEDDFD